MKDQFLNKDAPEPELIKDQFLNKDAPEQKFNPELIIKDQFRYKDSAPAPASEDYSNCPPAPYKCPRPCRGACCDQWGCQTGGLHPYPYGYPIRRGYGYGAGGAQNRINCGPPPYICPGLCRGPCCSQWGCY